MIDLSRWNEIKAIVQEALDLPEEERARYLHTACGEDGELRREVGALLAVSATQADFFDDLQVLPLSLQSPVFKEGETLGAYEIVQSLGEGGMGKVYLGIDSRNGRKAAIKVLPPTRANALAREQSILARLGHPNIATLFDSGPAPGGAGYFAMEYVEGEPITDYCNSRQLTLEKRLELFLAVCEAVAFAHRVPIVHRDIKPNNILVTADGIPKLLDFGIAKLLPSESSDLAVTRPEDRSLTIAFASPEQLEGEHTTTGTDIYSLGVLLCLLLTGRLPYPVKSYHDLPWAIRNMEAEKPSELALKEDVESNEAITSSALPGIDPRKLSAKLRGDLDAIVLKALRKEPEKRYQTVSELSGDIRHFLNKEPITARKGSRRYRAWKFLRRHSGGVALAAIFTAILFSLVHFLNIQYREARGQRDRALHEATRAQEAIQFLVTILRSADPWENKGASVTAKDLLEGAKLRVRRELSNQPDLRIVLIDHLGVASLNMGLHNDAIALLTAALSESDKLGTGDMPQTAEIATHLGDAYLAHGDYAKAQTLFMKAYSLRRRLVSPPHPMLASSLLNIGTSSLRMGDLKKAEEHYYRGFSMCRSMPIGDPALLSMSLHNLGSLELNKGNYKRAAFFYTRSLAIRRVIFGFHPETATTIDNLANVLSLLGDYESSERFYRRALQMRQEIFGDQHPSVTSTMTSYGQLLLRRDRLAEAEELLRRALVIKERNLPPYHPSIAGTLNHLAGLLQERGDYKGAEVLFRRALAIRRRAFGDIHPSIPESLNNLATVAEDLGRPDEAEQFFREALRILKALHRNGHPQIAMASNNLASLLVDQGRYPEAETLFTEAIEIAERQLGNDHELVGVFLRQKAELHLKQGNVDKAKGSIDAALQILRRKLPANHSRISKAESLMGEILLKQKRYSEAEPYLLRSLSTLQQSEVRPTGSSVASLRRLVTLYRSWGKKEEASKYEVLLIAAKRESDKP